LPLEQIASQAWKLANFDSQLMYDQLNEQLNYPSKTPFGTDVQEPRLYNESIHSLNSLKPQQKCRLAEYLDNSKVIGYVQQMGLKIGHEYFAEKVDRDFDILFYHLKKGSS
jgi:hypothetical protein